ncbi:uncharacterized protein TRUGW13939_08295 [Talaromyces rugulosus]|uniref:Phospholipid scramblase n=1 Tax=Talaromyces rugulosus TaxID=121627 RepID=A0A7H8R589_TALRU|nr:uncharacterized protein TRUGW13939_08295 [Talaromyces rugulosus]QKX61148.1 hypothetical protein TRUGW13939_08295 [Talaromyces rugulosus]
MLAKSIIMLWALFLLMATAQAQFQFFEQMFSGGGHGGHQGEQEASSDSSWYQRTWEGAHCTRYLCPGTLACVHFPHHCPCPHPDVEEKVELGEGSAVCASRGGFKAGETARKIELARKGLLVPPWFVALKLLLMTSFVLLLDTSASAVSEDAGSSSIPHLVSHRSTIFFNSLESAAILLSEMKRALPFIPCRNFTPRRSVPRNSLRRKDLLLPTTFYRSVHEKNSERNPASNIENVSTALRDTIPQKNNLLSPVHIPEDPNAVLKETHLAAKLLANSSLVVLKDIDMINVLAGFEQSTRYVIMDANGNHVGYMAEQETGVGGMLSRPWTRSHRSFTMHVFDRDQKEVLRFQRPFSWFNGHIRVYDPLDLADPAYSPSNTYQPTPPTAWASIASNSKVAVSPLSISDMRVIGEAQLKWTPFRRKYNLFIFHPNSTSKSDLGTKHVPATSGKLSQTQQMQLQYQSGGANSGGHYNQFAYVNERPLSRNFSIRSEGERLIGSVNRNFAGFSEEFLFGTGGVYALRMDAVALAEKKERQHTNPTSTTGMTLDQRAVMLAGAVSIDFDFFSRAVPNNPWYWLPVDAGMAASASQTATAGGASTGITGAAAGSAVSSVGRIGAIGSLADGVTAAGTVAGYETMRQSMDGNHSPSPYQGPSTPTTPAQSQSQGEKEVWGEVLPQVPPQASPEISEKNSLGELGPGGGAAGSNVPGGKGGDSLSDIVDLFL